MAFTLRRGVPCSSRQELPAGIEHQIKQGLKITMGHSLGENRLVHRSVGRHYRVDAGVDGLGGKGAAVGDGLERAPESLGGTRHF